MNVFQHHQDNSGIMRNVFVCRPLFTHLNRDAELQVLGPTHHINMVFTLRATHVRRSLTRLSCADAT